jgi:hypothetical protein
MVSRAEQLAESDEKHIQKVNQVIQVCLIETPYTMILDADFLD